MSESYTRVCWREHSTRHQAGRWHTQLAGSVAAPGPLVLWLRWVHGLPSLTECPRFCMSLTRRRSLPFPSAKGENTLIQRKSLWINLLTFRFVINTYRCLYVNGILGKPHVNTPLGTKTSGADTRKYCICTSLY